MRIVPRKLPAFGPWPKQVVFEVRDSEGCLVVCMTRVKANKFVEKWNKPSLK